MNPQSRENPSAECSPEALRRAASELARIGGETARRYFGNVKVVRKADDSPVTEADHAAQDEILRILSERYPAHAIVGEETIARPDRHAEIADAKYCWVIDPIDGTRNFSRGANIYATSVAVMDEQGPLAGAIYDATSESIYSAARGGGAFADERPMALRARPIDSDTNVMVSSFRRTKMPPPVREWMDRFLFRNYGSLCLHLAWVAAGLGDAAFSIECKLWDIVAGALIITEAGGVVTDQLGQPIWPMDVAAYAGEDLPILAGSASLHAELLRSLFQK